MTEKILQKIVRQNSNPELIRKAFDFAKEAHLGQKRSSGEDYVEHPLEVARILTEMKMDSNAVAAGFLHDVLDDTPRTTQELEKEFGKKISFLVQGVSKLGKIRYPKKGLEVKPAQERLQEPIDLRAENLRKMFFAMGQDLRVVLIKLADRLHNMETLGSLPPEKQKRIALETMEIFAPLANRLGMEDMKGRLEDLAFSYLYPKEYEWLMKNVKEKREAREKYLERVKSVLVKNLKKNGIKIIDVHYRPKYYWSLYRKLLKYETDFDRIYDLVALRVIVEDVKTCYQALGILHKLWKPLPGRIKDYIAFPKPNGYQALHTTLFCLEGKIIEIQIKTDQMHRESEYGICAHWAEKEGINLKTERKKFAWVSQLKEWQNKISSPQEFWKRLKIDFFKNRIFVFTPKGDVIDLPEEATPVDFAYAVHTAVGNKCSAAKVNGKMVALSSVLKNGDMVEIITEKNKTPSRNWLEFTKTSMARSRIKNWLKQESRPQNLERGKKLLDETFKQMKGIPFSALDQKQKDKLLETFRYKSLETLTVSVGEGEVSPREVFKALFKEKDVFSISPPKIMPKAGKKDPGISLAGQSRIQTHLAKCCLPQPGDKIKAYITREHGASVHKVGCKNLEKVQKKWPQKIIEAQWPEGEKILYPVFFKVLAEDRVGLFRDVSSAISEMGINILNYEAKSQGQEKQAVINAKVEISGLEQLNGLFDQLKRIKGVTEVKKSG